MIGTKYFIFILNGRQYAMKLYAVEKVVRSSEMLPVPENIDFLMGLINMEGRIIPVFDIRQRFNLPSREIDLNDRFIISHTSGGTIAFIVDEVQGIVEFPDNQIHKANKIFHKMEDFIEGVWESGEKSILIYNVDKLFPACQLPTDTSGDQ
ncbi:Chemotaxis protein cheW [Candidatus Magnetomoraceae bacterium gMMP-15]